MDSRKGFGVKAFVKKMGMTRIFDQDAAHRPVTVFELQKTVYLAKKSNEKDGYIAAVYGLARDDEKLKGMKGCKRVVEEKNTAEEIKVGDKIDINLFKQGDRVVVYGKSKGKGFAGPIKRHGFNTGPKTHGSCNYRKPGSIGATGPSHVIKGRRMAGQKGHKDAKVKNLVIEKIDGSLNQIWVRGSVPGPSKAVLVIEKI